MHYCVQSVLAQNFVKGGAHNYAMGKLINTYHVYTVCMSPALECIKRGNMIEICNGIMFDFYLRLPHAYCDSCE